MATWGTYYLGFRYPISKEQPLEADKIYEGRFTSPIDIPDNLELPLIRELMKLKLEEPSAETTFIYVKRRTVIVQWYQRTASPISAGAIFVVLVGLALLVLAVGLTLVSLSKVEGIPATFGIPTSLILSGFGFLMIIMIMVLIILPAIRGGRKE
jgi:hypothetical protein